LEIEYYELCDLSNIICMVFYPKDVNSLILMF
jgi:hypothetical protein